MNDRELIQRLLDGELDVEEAANLRARAVSDPQFAAELSAFEAMARGVAALPRPVPPENLEAHILRRVAGTAERSRGGFFRAGSFFPLRHTWAAPAVLAAGLAASITCAWWLGYRTGSARMRDAASRTASPEVVVRFSLNAPHARSVEVAGDFNAWRPERGPLALGSAGTWTATLKLPAGRHEYLFVIDGKRWVPDPSASELVDDGFGGKNAVIEVL